MEGGEAEEADGEAGKEGLQEPWQRVSTCEEDGRRQKRKKEMKKKKKKVNMGVIWAKPNNVEATKQNHCRKRG